MELLRKRWLQGNFLPSKGIYVQVKTNNLSGKEGSKVSDSGPVKNSNSNSVCSEFSSNAIISLLFTITIYGKPSKLWWSVDIAKEASS